MRILPRKILVTGCYAQRAPGELSVLPGVSLVVGNSHKHEVADYALPLTAGTGFVPLTQISGTAASNVIIGDIFAHTELLAAPVFEGEDAAERTRPNLKVQDGCNNRCSFCIIPFVRGRSRSLQLDDVIRETNALVARGYREIVLSGINLGRWGRDLAPRSSFAAMLRAILESTGIEKLRISSVEPMDWSNELIESRRVVTADCQACSRPFAVGKRQGATPHASQVPALALCRSHRTHPARYA